MQSDHEKEKKKEKLTAQVEIIVEYFLGNSGLFHLKVTPSCRVPL